jgi:hypothetical protein
MDAQLVEKGDHRRRISCEPLRPDSFSRISVLGPEKIRARHGRRRDAFCAITQAHSGLLCPELVQLRPQIVPWSKRDISLRFVKA